MSDILTTPKPRRNAELLMLILALAVRVGANALAGLDQDKGFSRDFYVQSLTLAILVFAVHLALRFRAKYADPVMLPIVTALNGLGLAMIQRLDVAMDPATTAAARQLMWTASPAGPRPPALL